VNLLNAIYDMPATRVTSVDILQQRGDYHVAHLVGEVYPNGNPQHSLILGKDIAEVIDGFEEQFDFVVLDTGHEHPCETLNFLSFLPYLKKNAIVVMHDLIVMDGNGWARTAPLLLYCSLCCPHLLSTSKNMGAMQITQELHANIKNTFQVLGFPWQYSPQPYILSAIQKIISKHYNEECQALFAHVLKLNAEKIVHFLPPQSQQTLGNQTIQKITSYLNSYQQVFFYGAGNNCKLLLNIFRSNNIPYPKSVFDIQAKKLNPSKFRGTRIIYPNYESITDPSHTLIIITLAKETEALNVMKYLSNIGFHCIHIKFPSRDILKLAKEF
jgi:hypothetical protein